MGSVGLVPGALVRPEFGPDFVYLRRVVRADAETLVIAPKSFENRDGTTTIGSRLDLRRVALGLLFQAAETLLVAYCPDGLLVTRLPSRRQARRRWERLVAAAHRGELATASLFTGLGTLDAALHDGLRQAGFRAASLWANDNWEPAVEGLMADNPARPRTALACGIEEVVALTAERELPVPDLLVMGLPCKGASKLNIRDRATPERHPVVGHQILNVAMVLQALRHNTPLILLENVTAYADTVSCAMLTKVLTEQGYAVALVGDRDDLDGYQGLNGADFGDMERRRRMALLAYPPQLEPFLDWRAMRRSTSTQTVGEIREPEHLVPSGEYDKGLGLPAKAARRFKMKVAEDADTSVGVISSDCWKQRVEDPRLRAKDGSGRVRLPLPEEHARLKGQPEGLIRSLPTNTAAHTALGNGTTRRVWVEFGRALGLAVRRSQNLSPAPGLPA